MDDKELLSLCVEKFGTKRALAKHLGVKPQTVSGWGERLPIPRHVRPRLMALIEPETTTLPWRGEERRTIFRIFDRLREVEQEHGRRLHAISDVLEIVLEAADDVARRLNKEPDAEDIVGLLRRMKRKQPRGQRAGRRRTK